MTPRRLIVMRHAKAEPYAATDHDRALTERGRAEAAEAGRFLASESLVPDHALVSSAARTRATWEEVAAASGSTAEPRFEDAVYTGSPQVVLAELRTLPEEAGTVLFVGHNPTAAYLAGLLDDGEGDVEAEQQMLQGFPTSALAVFEVEVRWADLDEGSGRLTRFHVGHV